MALRVLGLIPARAGSKGVPGKNTRPLGGKPLIGWTVDAARGARSLARVVVSTEDPGIAEVARLAGAEVPFTRPPELAADTTPMLPVVLHALETLEAGGDAAYDAVCLLQPTTPLRTSSDIDAAVDLLTRTGADSVLSFCQVDDAHPARMRTVDEAGRVGPGPVAEGEEGARRQDLPPYYLRAGSIYLSRRAVLEGGSFAGEDCRALIVPRDRAVNIDGDLDWVLAEALVARLAAGDRR
jgi:N-acylneuraminate cytidylyltransferase